MTMLSRHLRIAATSLFVALGSAAAHADWTSYAINGQGAVGHGRGPTKSAAQNFALGWCGQPNCKIVMTRTNRCVAIAESRHNGYWFGTGAAGSREGAIGYAMSWCGKYAPISTCSLRHSYCK